MDFEGLLLDIDAGVATITLNRPDQLNPIDEDVLDTLLAALDHVGRTDDVRVVRLKGAGRVFSAGGNLKSLYDWFDYEPEVTGSHAWELGQSRAELDREWVDGLIERLLRIRAFRKPIVAQVHGYCIGGGVELVGVSDVIFAAEDTKFAHPPIRAHGILTTLGMWPFRIGMLKTKELLFTGDAIDGIEAERIGMINHAVPAEELDAVTLAYCRRAAQVPLAGLTTAKLWTNRWFDIAGMRTAASEGAEFDALLHTDPAFDEFVRIAKDEGLKAALEWRDDPFRSDRS
jgi:enoyl-CoA hydratase